MVKSLSCPKVKIQGFETIYINHLNLDKDTETVICKMTFSCCPEYDSLINMLPLDRKLKKRFKHFPLNGGNYWGEKPTTDFSLGYFRPENYTYIGIARYKKGDENSIELAKKVAYAKASRKMWRFIAKCYRGVLGQIVDYVTMIGYAQFDQCKEKTENYEARIITETNLS